MGEEERPPGRDARGQEAEPGRVEARLAVAARDLAQRAVEVVRPRVVGALQRRARPLAVEDRVAAVAADVDERAQLAVAAADDHERHRAGVDAQEAAGLGDLVGAAGVVPAAPEDQLLLAREQLRVGVPARGEAVPGAQAVGHRVEPGGIVQDAHRRGTLPGRTARAQGGGLRSRPAPRGRRGPPAARRRRGRRPARRGRARRGARRRRRRRRACRRRRRRGRRRRPHRRRPRRRRPSRGSRRRPRGRRSRRRATCPTAGRRRRSR